jgi:Domain of unknown function (DUF1830)
MGNPSHLATSLAQLSCGYRNSSDRMVIVRCIGPEEFFLERVVFPFELLSFLAPPEAVVQIWTHGLGGPELIETLDVRDLQVEEAESEPLSLASAPRDDLLYEWQEAV